MSIKRKGIILSCPPKPTITYSERKRFFSSLYTTIREMRLREPNLAPVPKDQGNKTLKRTSKSHSNKVNNGYLVYKPTWYIAALHYCQYWIVNWIFFWILRKKGGEAKSTKTKGRLIEGNQITWDSLRILHQTCVLINLFVF